MTLPTDALHREPVVIGLTRPAMLLKIPHTAFLAVLMVSLLAMIWTNDIKKMVMLFPALWAIAFQITRRDKRRIDVWLLKLKSCPPARNWMMWRGNAYLA